MVDEEHCLAYHCDGRPGELRAIPPESVAVEGDRFSTDSRGVSGLRGVLGPHALDDAPSGETGIAAALLLAASSITPSRFDSRGLRCFTPAMAVAASSGVARRPVETGEFQKQPEQTVGNPAVL